MYNTVLGSYGYIPVTPSRTTLRGHTGIGVGEGGYPTSTGMNSSPRDIPHARYPPQLPFLSVSTVPVQEGGEWVRGVGMYTLVGRDPYPVSVPPPRYRGIAVPGVHPPYIPVLGGGMWSITSTPPGLPLQYRYESRNGRYPLGESLAGIAASRDTVLPLLPVLWKA